MRVSQNKTTNSISTLRRYALATVSLIVLTAQSAFAQQLADAGQTGSSVEEVLVTGSRVVRDGYDAPTPVTVIGADQIEAMAPPNLSEYINQMPSIIGSSTADNSSGSLSNGQAGIAALNLRSLGVNRTLVLLNGHRTPASSSTGYVDINTIPQELVKRIDVVTGGASADYGSDAVGGVVNFILDTDFTGLKGGIEYSQTTDGRQPSYKANLTGGFNFAGGKGHVLLSGEFVSTAPINNYNPDWNNKGFFRIVNPAYAAGNGQPYYLITSGIGASQVAPGGLVVSGPLKGTYFGVNASVNQLAYGATSGPWMVGGDTAVTMNNYVGTNSLSAGEIRENFYGRGSYSVTADIETYIEASLTRYKGISYYMQPTSVGGVTIMADNAFLPASFKAQMTAQHLSSVTIGTTDSGFPLSGSRNGREVQRLAAGASGSAHVLADWKWDVHAQIGVANLHEAETAVWNTSKLALAQDAVVVTAANVGSSGLALGSIACRSTLTNPSNGCMPLSRIGVNGGLQSAADFQAGLGYVLGTPYREQRISEQSYSFNVTGDPFSNWQGPVSIAFGGEWRLEAINGFVPAQYQSGWLFGNYKVNKGHYSVAEGYVETVVPLLKNFDFNGAFRYTAYSTSGGVNTWKTGLTYSPTPDVKFRATYSHDIRAPNLDELFAAGTARTNTVNINNVSYTFVQNQTGNKDLMPEAANSLGVGAAFTPTFIDGLAFSIDYYNITISKAIGSITAQNTADQCFIQNVQSYCDNISYNDGTTAKVGVAPPAAGLSTIKLVPFNFTKQKAEGIDFDVTYHVPLDAIDVFGQVPGSLTLNALATNYIRNYTNSGVNPSTDIAGVNAGSGTPSWVYRFTATYNLDPWTVTLIGRGVSDGKYSNEYITCTSACPAYTLANPTTTYNHIDGAFYVDMSVNYNFAIYGIDTSAVFAVKNFFDTNPPLVASGPDGNNVPAYVQTNRNLYDYLGRVIRFGLRFKT